MKSYTTIEQSRKLAEFLPLESADMCYLSEESLVPKVNYNGMVFFNSEEEKTSTIISCWSLAALLGVLPKEIVYNKNIVYLEFHVWQNSLEYVNNADYILHITRSYDNPVDACVAMIEKLHEFNLL